MKKTMSVSVDEGLIKLAKEGAYEGRVSFSKFVEDAIRLRVDVEILEGMKNKPVAKPRELRQEEKDEIIPDEPDKISDDETQERARLQSELDKSREKRDIKQDRLAAGRGIIEKPVTSLTGFSGGYSKASQTGKKGVK